MRHLINTFHNHTTDHQFCHFLKWFLSFVVCTEKNTDIKDYVGFSVRQSVQFKPMTSVFYWFLNSYFLWIQYMLTICAFGFTCISSHPYIISFNTGYSMTGRQSGTNLFIFKTLLKSFRSCKVLNWKENLGSNNKERQTVTSEPSIKTLLSKNIYAISQKTISVE